MECLLKLLNIIITVVSVLLVSCTYTAKKVHDPDCKMFFPKIELESEKVDAYKKCQVGGIVPDICFHLVGIVKPVGSAIYAGSVCLVGNTLSWLEYHGKCEEGALKKALDDGKSESHNK